MGGCEGKIEKSIARPHKKKKKKRKKECKTKGDGELQKAESYRTLLINSIRRRAFFLPSGALMLHINLWGKAIRSSKHVSRPSVDHAMWVNKKYALSFKENRKRVNTVVQPYLYETAESAIIVIVVHFSNSCSYSLWQFLYVKIVGHTFNKYICWCLSYYYYWTKENITVESICRLGFFCLFFLGGGLQKNSNWLLFCLYTQLTSRRLWWSATFGGSALQIGTNLKWLCNLYFSLA